MQRREEFRKWLSETNRKKNGKLIIESTIECYVRTIDNISEDMLKSKVIDKNLYNVLSFSELDQMVNKIKKDAGFINKNAIGHHRQSCALEHYMDFIHDIM